jgi:pimeloyl-ACP methyl ester carboxylesterase
MDNPIIDFERSIYVDPQGREFHYIHVNRGNSDLGIHFSAFFGDWGDHPKYRQTFGGYFHRLKMLSSDNSMDWLFLCDTYGADNNGTYYIGKSDDQFVERAIVEILKIIKFGSRYQPERSVMIGSSMGATAALKFGLLHEVKGIIAISPHIDLDVCAKLQGRERHVSWVLNFADTQSPDHFATTRNIRNILDEKLLIGSRIPNLFVQSCRDDYGVHYEQVVPLVNVWKKSTSKVWFDERRSGGHTSEFATRPILLDAVHRLLSNETLPIAQYKFKNSYRPYGLPRGLYLNIRRTVGRLKQRVLQFLRR